MMAFVRMIQPGAIQAVVVAYYGYETMHALLNYAAFAYWCRVLPYFSKLASVVAFVASAAGISIILLLVLGKVRTAMQCALWGSILFTSYLCVALLTTDWFFLPFHPYWPGMTWLSRMIVALIIGWGCWYWLRVDSEAEKKKAITH